MEEVKAGGLTLDAMEIDAIGEVMNISMGAAATAVSTMLDKTTIITTPSVQVASLESVDNGRLEPAILVKITYTEGITGSNVMVFRQQDLQLILNCLMGIDEPPSDDFVFDDLSMSAACEVMNQMMGASATALSDFLGISVNISTPTATIMDDQKTFQTSVGGALDTEVVLITFNLSIKDMMNSEFVSVLSVDFAKTIVNRFMVANGLMPEENVSEAPTAAPMPTPMAAPMPAPPAAMPPPASAPAMPPMAPQTAMPAAMPAAAAPPVMPQQPQMPQMPAMPQQQQAPPSMPQQMPGMMPQMPQQQMPQQQQGYPPMGAPQPPMGMMGGMDMGMPGGGMQPFGGGYGMPPMGMMPFGYPPYGYPMYGETGGMPPGATVKNVQFPEFSQAEKKQDAPVMGNNMDLIMNVPLDVSIEIGATKRRIKEIMDFSQGTVIELDKQAGAPVDIVVNGQLIAHGDVVVIDDNFGVRITEIVGTKELVSALSAEAKKK